MAITAGGNLNSVPAPQQATLASNYIDFRAAGTAGWAQQYLPELMEQEAEVFGQRTVGGFLEQVGAEEAMTSDQVVWSEQGRLHLSYTGTILAAASNTITLINDIDGNLIGGDNHGIRVGDTVIVASATTTAKCYVTTVPATLIITAIPYEVTAGTGNLDDVAPAFADGDAVTVLVYGSEWVKGATDSGSGAAGRTHNEPQFLSFANKPIIMKDFYMVNGSDTAQIGWIETTQEDGQTGYMWYLKAAGETRLRFSDYMEMAMVEAVRPLAASTDVVDTALSGAGTPIGTQGLFQAIEDRGNMTSGITGVTAATDLAEFDAILAEFDNQGAIEENMIFANRATALAMDDMLASMNSYGAGGTSYGVFSNSEDMALNLGFSGFRRGSYDFYKTDWKYLNDAATRGGINARNTAGAIRGVMIPAGTSSVYDQQLGKNLKRPFLHVRYRASQTDNRYLKTWVTGSVGAATSNLDAMEIHYLTERCLITQGANNFMLLN
jgi:hypothetical protein